VWETFSQQARHVSAVGCLVVEVDVDADHANERRGMMKDTGRGAPRAKAGFNHISGLQLPANLGVLVGLIFVEMPSPTPQIGFINRYFLRWRYRSGSADP